MSKRWHMPRGPRALLPTQGWALPHGRLAGASLNPPRPSLPRGVAIHPEGSVTSVRQPGFPAWLRLNPHAQAPSRRVLGAPVSAARPASFRAVGGVGWRSAAAGRNVSDGVLLRDAATFLGGEDLPGEGRAAVDARAPEELPGEGRVGLGDGHGTGSEKMRPGQLMHAILECEDTKELARLVEANRFGRLLPRTTARGVPALVRSSRILTWNRPPLRICLLLIFESRERVQPQHQNDR